MDMKPTLQPGTKLPPIIECSLSSRLIDAQLRGHVEPHLRHYRMGEVNILVAHSPEGGWHLSASAPDRLPTWDELMRLRYALVPDGVTMAMLLPPRTEYVNVHPNTLHLWQI